MKEQPIYHEPRDNEEKDEKRRRRSQKKKVNMAWRVLKIWGICLAVAAGVLCLFLARKVGTPILAMYVDAESRKEELRKNNEMEGRMFKMKDDPRITPVGRFLRKTSLDELPQFYNVLKGDMSLVGTRPPTEDEFEHYSPHYRRRLSITPGLTGMWQVSGRSDITDFDEVVRLDLEYIDNWSLLLDVKILLQTIGVVLTGKGSK